MEQLDTSIIRPLQADGRVPCPVHREMVTLDRCYACGSMLSAVRAVDGSGGQVTCDPPIGALLEQFSAPG